MKKNKTYNKKLTKHRKRVLNWLILPLTAITTVCIMIGANACIAGYRWVFYPPEYSITDVNIEKLKIYPKPNNNIKEYVLKEVYEAGLDPSEAECLIKHESNWDDYAYNINNNGTTDFGLWMINSIHKATISPKDRLDYKKATEWAIEKRLRDGNWSAWYGYLYNCI